MVALTFAVFLFQLIFTSSLVHSENLPHKTGSTSPSYKSYTNRGGTPGREGRNPGWSSRQSLTRGQKPSRLFIKDTNNPPTDFITNYSESLKYDVTDSGEVLDPPSFKILNETRDPDGTFITFYFKTVKTQPDGTEVVVDDDDRSPGTKLVFLQKTTRPDGTVVMKEVRRNNRRQVSKQQPGSIAPGASSKVFDSTGYRVMNETVEKDGTEVLFLQKTILRMPDGSEVLTVDNDSAPNAVIITVEKRTEPSGYVVINEIRSPAQRTTDRRKPFVTHNIIEDYDGPPSPQEIENFHPRFNSTGYKIVNQTRLPDGSEITTYRKIIRKGPDGREDLTTDNDRSPGSTVLTTELKSRPDGSVFINEFRRRIPSPSAAQPATPAADAFDPSGYKFINTSVEPDGTVVQLYQKTVRKLPHGAEVIIDEGDNGPGAVLVSVERRIHPHGKIIIKETRKVLRPKSRIQPDISMKVIDYDYDYPALTATALPPITTTEVPFNYTGFKVVSDRRDAEGTWIVVFRKTVKTLDNGTETLTDENDDSPSVTTVTVERRTNKYGIHSFKEIRSEPKRSTTSKPAPTPAVQKALKQYPGFSIEKSTSGLDGSFVLIVRSTKISKTKKITRKRLRVSKAGKIEMEEELGDDPYFTLAQHEPQLDEPAQQPVQHPVPKTKPHLGNSAVPAAPDNPHSHSKLGNLHEVEHDVSYRLASTKLEKDGTYVYIYRKKVRHNKYGSEITVDYADKSPAIVYKVVEKRRMPDGRITYAQSYEEFRAPPPTTPPSAKSASAARPPPNPLPVKSTLAAPKIQHTSSSPRLHHPAATKKSLKPLKHPAIPSSSHRLTSNKHEGDPMWHLRVEALHHRPAYK